jgi:hypothetical protein
VGFNLSTHDFVRVFNYISPENAIEATRSAQSIRCQDSVEKTRSLHEQSVLTLLMEPQDPTPLLDLIQITVCPRKKTISIRDFGIGMTNEKLEHAVTIGWPKSNSSEQCTEKVSMLAICIITLLPAHTLL